MSEADDEMAARIEYLTRRIAEQAADRQVVVIADAEAMIAAMPSTAASVPSSDALPGHGHPFYDAGARRLILELMDRREWWTPIKVLKARRLSVADWVGDDAYPTAVSDDVLVLTPERMTGDAPFVGQPFAYVWLAARDDHGRYVGGDRVERVALPAYPTTVGARR